MRAICKLGLQWRRILKKSTCRSRNIEDQWYKRKKPKDAGYYLLTDGRVVFYTPTALRNGCIEIIYR